MNSLKTKFMLFFTTKHGLSRAMKFFPQSRLMSRQIGKGQGRQSKPTITSNKSNSPETLENVLYNKNMGFRQLLRPFAFTCVVSACSFGGCAIWQYENMRSKAFASRIFNYNQGFTPKQFGIRDKINQWFNSLSATQKLVVGIIATNVAVYGCWQVPALRMFMLKWFAASPAAPSSSLPMLLSVFSHHSLWHLAINMVVLWSFTPSIGQALGKEQFFAFYMTGGVLSSFGSYCGKVMMGAVYPSLGASGAIMAVLAAVCTLQPEGRLSIIFLPFFTFSAATALKGLLCLETAGIVLRWKLFDHAAHLSGLLFGWYYASDGYKRIWGQREPYLKRWHDMRNKPVDK